MRSISSSSLTPQVSTTQIKQFVTGNARTLLHVTHLSKDKNKSRLIQYPKELLLINNTVRQMEANRTNKTRGRAKCSCTST